MKGRVFDQRVAIRRAALGALSVVMCVGAASGDVDDATIAKHLIETWRKAQQPAVEADHGEKAWVAFIRKHPDHDFGRLARLLAGVEVLRQGGDRGRALAYFDLPPVKPRPLEDEVDEVEEAAENKPPTLSGFITHAAAGLTAAVRMEMLADQLRRYYRRHIEYPRALTSLVDAGQIAPQDLLDPFGQPYEYAAEARKLLPDVPRQRFVLACTSAGVTQRQFVRSLQGHLEPARRVMLSRMMTDKQMAFVRTKQEDGTFGPSQRWRAGALLNGMVLWHVGDGFAIGSWRQFPRLIESPPAGPVSLAKPPR